MDIDVQDSGSAPDALPLDHRSRRRLIGAGLVGVAGSLLPRFAGRVGASAPDDTADSPADTAAPSDAGEPGGGEADPPPTDVPEDSTGVTVISEGAPGGSAPEDDGAPPAAATTTSPERRPTDADAELLWFAQSMELAAAQLYESALEGDAVADHRDLFVTLHAAHLAYRQSLGSMIGTSAPDVALEAATSAFSAGFGGSTAEVISAAYDLEATAVATYEDVIGQLVGTDGAAAVAAIVTALARHCTVLAHLGGSTSLDELLLSDADALAPTES